MASKRNESSQSAKTLDVVLDGLGNDDAPALALYAVDPDGSVKRKLATVKQGKLAVDPKWARETQVVGLGPDTKEDLKRESLQTYRLEEAWPKWQKTGTIEIVRPIWIGWIPWRKCVSGTASWCTPTRPWGTFETAILRARCRPMCNGVIEVYERNCCCRPWVIYDPRIKDLIGHLKVIIKIPPIPEPEPDPLLVAPRPSPGPDPSPFDRDAVRAMKEMKAFQDPASYVPTSERLVADYKVLQSASLVDASAYVMGRPYLSSLLCHCTSRKVGEAILNPDGTFSFCYSRLPILLRGCSTTYVYKVKQWQDNQWVYVYDGFASHDYYGPDEQADLTVRSRRVRGCETPNEPPIDHDRPFVMLQDIGTTSAYLLQSPPQQGLGAINQALPYNGGLAYPAASAQSAKGLMLDRPWSKTLKLRLHFSSGMKALGARYYRLSVLPCDGNGNPTSATPRILSDGVSWNYYTWINSQVQINSTGLGPHSPVDAQGTTQAGLFTIPYWSDQQWLNGQYHQAWDTTIEPGTRHLLIVEVFDANGNRLRPNPSTGLPTDTSKNFDFLRWTEAPNVLNNTTVIPFANLAHVFWLDHLHCYGDIVDLRKDGVPNTQECQFTSGVPSSQFSVGFRAFHDRGAKVDEPFMLSYSIWWHRGLNGPSDALETGNVNRPPTKLGGPPAQSLAHTFAHMLANPFPGGPPMQKCTFTVYLRVYAKHTTGSEDLRYDYGAAEDASFALDISP